MKRVLTIVAILVGFKAQAGLLLDPFLRYSLGSGEQSGAGITVDYDYSGVAYGSRLGWSFTGVMLGGEYALHGESDLEFTSSGVAVADAHNRTDLGAFVGYDAGMWRVWVTYYLDSKFEDQDGADAGDEINGSGFGIALGWRLMPWVSLNFQYQALSYDEQVVSGQTESLGASIDMTNILFGVSFPLSLM